MNRDFFLNPGLQFAQWKSTPETGFSPEQCPTDGISRPNWGNSDRYTQFEPALFSTTGSTVVKSPIMDQFVKENLPTIQNSMAVNPNLPLLAADPGFVERAAKFSCFGSRSFNGRDSQLGVENSNSIRTEALFVSGVSPVSGTGKFPRVSSSPALKLDRCHVGFEENRNSEESSVSEQVPSPEVELKNKKDLVSRKRKGVSLKKGEEVIDELKKVKKTEEENGGKVDENTKPPEPVKDYIHVRARRGQATDSHSLAERVRREKISERMKLLQNLVPNCNKVTGKALMLDEIINYVQSLQRQVEFLSMKLATVDPSLDNATNDIISQNINQQSENLSQQTSHFYQDHQELFNESVREFIQPFPHFQGFGQDDLQSIVRMGFSDSLDLDTSFFPMTHDQPSNMKTEL